MVSLPQAYRRSFRFLRKRRITVCLFSMMVALVAWDVQGQSSLTVAFDGVPDQSADQPKGVCSVLAVLPQYRGRLVTMNGLLRETIEGAYLGDWNVVPRENCDALARRGLQWPAQIYLEWSYAAEETIAQQIDVFRSQVAEHRRVGQVCAIVADVTGKLETRTRIRIRHVKKGGPYSGNGYGPGGACAAKLEVQEIRGIRLVCDEELNSNRRAKKEVPAK